MKIVEGFIAGTLTLAVLVSATASHAQSRVAKIRETRSITLGYPETQIPFAYLDESQKPAGYTIDICRYIVEKIRIKLSMDDINITYNPTASASRIPLISNGTIDLECGATTNNAERHRYVAFSPTVFVAQVVIVTRADAGVNPDDLSTFRGKSVAAQAGGQGFKTLSRMNAVHGFGIDVVPSKDTAETFLMLESGRAAGVASDDVLAYTRVAISPTPATFIIGRKGLDFAPYGIMEPKDDAEFKALVDNAVVDAMHDGTIESLYKKYFDSPSGSGKISLSYPIGDALRHAIVNPTDSPDPSAYH